jgi:hypothetical protein
VAVDCLTCDLAQTRIANPLMKETTR